MSNDRRRHPNVSVGLIALAALLLVTQRAQAQGCCASGASLTPIRLDLHERALVGLQVTANAQHGSFSNSAKYRSIPGGASDVELRQTLFATFGPWSRLQASVLAPWVETRRDVSGNPSEWGGGLGDLGLAVRGEPIQLREHGNVPGVAIIGSLVAPTGTAPEAAEKLLGSDTTGAGAWRFGGGFALEQAYAAFLLNLTTTVSLALPRDVGATRVEYAPRWNATLGVGYAVSHYWHLALLAGFEYEGSPRINGDAGHPRRHLEPALLTTHLLDDGLRLQAGLNLTPPVTSVGRNDLARVGASLSVVRSWL